jgi:outer membrane protein assembly factor BamB
MIAALALALSHPIAPLNDWPQWRGPERTGVSSEAGWVPEGREAWKANVGLGYSCVSIAAGRLFTMGHDVERGLDVIVCLDAETGEEHWSHEYPAERWNKMHAGGTNSTPTVVGDRVYTLNREGWFKCLSAAKGELLFERNLKEELALELPEWGFAASPLSLDDGLYLNVGVVLSVDPKSGDTIWRTEKDYGHAYSTPAAFSDGETQALAIHDSKGLAVLDRRNGEELGFQEWKAAFEVAAATPVVLESGVFVSSGMRKGGGVFALGEEGLELVWKNEVMGNKMSGCVLFDGHLYGFDEPRFKCMTTTGEERWSTRDLGMGALMVADGKLICVSEKGELVIAEATPEEFRVLSRQQALDDKGSVCWTSPVLSNGRIYLRNNTGTLVCLDHRQQERKDL